MMSHDVQSAGQSGDPKGWSCIEKWNERIYRIVENRWKYIQTFVADSQMRERKSSISWIHVYYGLP